MKKSTALFMCATMALLVKAQTNSVTDSVSKVNDSLKTVTVTATRTVKDVMNVGRDVTVITHEQIENASCNTLAELLSQQAGIFIDGTGQNPGVIQTMFLRGADNNHTTIMIDGVPVSDPSNDHNELDLSELSLGNIDHIEIVRGSHSTLYGSSAMGGVVNIITSGKLTLGLHLDISETGGEFGPNTQLFEENAFINYTFKDGLYAEAGYHRWDDKGLSAAVDTLSHPLAFQQNPQNNLDKGDLMTKIGFKNDKWNAYFEYRNTNQTFGIPEGAYQPANNYIGHLVRDFYTGCVSYKITPDLQIQYIGSYSPMIRSYLQDTTLMYFYGYYKSYISDAYTSKTTTNEVQATYNLKASQFILGAGSTYQTMNSNTVYWSGSVQDSTEYVSTSSLDTVKPYQTIYYGYAQADLNGGTFTPALSNLSLLLGGRFSTNSMFGNNFSYEINPSLKINKNNLLYASYSTGFNVPSLYQLYGQNDMQGDAISLANPYLKPETSASFELGVKHKMANSFITLSYFNTVVSNYIDYVYLWNSKRPVDSLGYADFLGDTYLNIGKETTQGFELNVFSQLDPKFSIAVNLSILSSSLEYSSSNIDTNHTHGNYVQLFNGGYFLTPSSGDVKVTGLLRRPGDMANITLTYSPIRRLNISAIARYVGTRTDAQYNPALGPYGAEGSTTIADYTLLDLLISCKITKNFSATLRCENVCNTPYTEILGYTALGRSFYLNIRYSL